MHRLRRTAAVLIWPAIAWLGACDQADPPTAGELDVRPQFGVGEGTNPGKVTGGGQINILDATTGETIGKATFGFNARREAGTPDVIRGHLNYVNHVTGVHLNCEVESGGLITQAGQEPGSASFGGYDCTPNSTFSDFKIDVVDRGEPGRDDSFMITYNRTIIDGSLITPIRSGNIQIHNK